MAVPTDQQILDEIRAAILEIVAGRGSSYTIAGRQFTALDLDKLRLMENEWKARVSRQKTGMFKPLRLLDA